MMRANVLYLAWFAFMFVGTDTVLICLNLYQSTGNEWFKNFGNTIVVINDAIVYLLLALMVYFRVNDKEYSTVIVLFSIVSAIAQIFGFNYITNVWGAIIVNMFACYPILKFSANAVYTRLRR